MQPTSENCRSIGFSLSGDGIISSISPEAELALGYSATDLKGRPITQILADKSVFEIHQNLAAAQESGHWEGDGSLRTRGGLPLPVRSLLLPMSSGSEGRSGFMMVSSPRCAGVAPTLDRLAIHEISSRLRCYAHEINNPMAVVMGFTQLILLNPQCGGRIRTDLERMYAEMGRIIHVVEKLHKYALSLREESVSRQVHASAAAS